MQVKRRKCVLTPDLQGWQAVAFKISGDKAYFSCCGLYGAQDTQCDDASRHYFKQCYIEGSIDFIFGNGRSMYKDCEVHSVATRFGSIAAPDRNKPDEKTGFAFVNCTVTGTGHGGPGAAAISRERELDFETAHPFLAKSFVNWRHWITPSDA
ncbi:putative pectinesterase 68 [Hibiscus syriacus]|uniref:Pectinesterase n=1 Tax=Hibiscus syriacus TaxID=106335 RepID=A0A6A2Y868_HIBSY|nr:putative pectinesterase 68 [Hibiscus syriacus]